jgi:hypothetical protein
MKTTEIYLKESREYQIMDDTKKRRKRKIRNLLLNAIILLYIPLNTIDYMAQQAAITNQINLWNAEVVLVLDVVVALFGIVGGFLIFMQYMQGNEQAQKNLIKFVIGLGIFGIIELVVKMFLV